VWHIVGSCSDRRCIGTSGPRDLGNAKGAIEPGSEQRCGECVFILIFNDVPAAYAQGIYAKPGWHGAVTQDDPALGAGSTRRSSSTPARRTVNTTVDHPRDAIGGLRPGTS
jgi:hypothetical protein